MKRLVEPHSGENITSLLKQMLQVYRLELWLGFCVLDNVSDNDTCLRVVQEYLQTTEVIWDANTHQLCCFDHVVNLIAIAFLENRPTKLKRPWWLSGQLKPVCVRSKDVITKLHAIIVFIMVTAQRIKTFEEINKSTHNSILHSVKEQITRWFLTLNMLHRAIKIKNSIDLYVAHHSTSAASEKTS